jgi:hypothetical protein
MSLQSKKQLFAIYRLTVLFAISLTLWAQDSTQSVTEDKRILWIFTNHRTTDDSQTLPNLTPRGKLAIAFGDATDQAIFVQTAFISGIGQLRMPTRLSGKGSRGTPNDLARRTLILP